MNAVADRIGAFSVQLAPRSLCQVEFRARTAAERYFAMVTAPTIPGHHLALWLGIEYGNPYYAEFRQSYGSYYTRRVWHTLDLLTAECVFIHCTTTPLNQLIAEWRAEGTLKWRGPYDHAGSRVPGWPFSALEDE